MDEAEFLAAVSAGFAAVSPEADLFALGEMGIGNTTAAAALAAALFGGGGERWAGRGTGVDDAGLARKRAVIDAALARHARGAGRSAARGDGGRRARTCGDPWRDAGGAAAANSGAAGRLRLHRRGRAAGVRCGRADWTMRASRIARRKPVIARWWRRSGRRRCSTSACGWARPPARRSPIPILRAALACHAGMATFAEAGVRDRD